MIVPCGQCIGCRLDNSIMWAARCYHEQSWQKYHYGRESCMLTLTYDDEHLPLTRTGEPTLQHRDVELFLKRVRKNNDTKFRYFLCGEYGKKNDRPHYHICMFGFKYDDERFDSMSGNGFPLFTSEKLKRDWRDENESCIGRATSQELTIETAAYCARYCTKKITGKNVDIKGAAREQTYATMSRKPGIGAEWFDAYGRDVINSECVVIKNGVKIKVPRYYDEMIKMLDPIEREVMVRKRKERGKLMFEKTSYKRRIDKERLKKYVNQKKLQRKFEEEK